jgi:N-methylhydantoinase B/oxoprolinase/acetone carboxylase alpha subunit
VLNDVRNGYVTRQKAREVYGVAVDAADGDFTLNEAQTRELRSGA